MTCGLDGEWIDPTIYETCSTRTWPQVFGIAIVVMAVMVGLIALGVCFGGHPHNRCREAYGPQAHYDGSGWCEVTHTEYVRLP
jgi:hypothetical protein